MNIMEVVPSTAIRAEIKMFSFFFVLYRFSNISVPYDYRIDHGYYLHNRNDLDHFGYDTDTKSNFHQSLYRGLQLMTDCQDDDDDRERKRDPY